MAQNKQFHDIVLLLQASKLFTQQKKAQIFEKLHALSDFDLIQIQGLLEQEQRLTTQYYQSLSTIEKEYSEKKLKAVYAYAEKKTQEREAAEEEDLLEALEEV